LAVLAFSVGGTASAIAEPAWTKRQSEPKGINASTKSNNAAACPLNPQALRRCNYQSQSPAAVRKIRRIRSHHGRSIHPRKTTAPSCVFGRLAHVEEGILINQATRFCIHSEARLAKPGASSWCFFSVNASHRIEALS
jgi:hypothetical protein